jgi:hypothetical protein
MKVYARKRAQPKAESEKTTEEKKAERRQRKRIRQREKREKEADMKLVSKLNPGKGNPYAQKKALEDLRQVSSFCFRIRSRNFLFVFLGCPSKRIGCHFGNRISKSGLRTFCCGICAFRKCPIESPTEARC